jgi:hypothetical protein
MDQASAAAKTRSKGHRKTLKAAEHKTGEKTGERRWSRELVVVELSKASKRGQPLWSRHLRKSNPALHSAAIHWFGNYRNAVAAAGLDYSNVRKLELGRWNPKTVCRQLRQLHQQKLPIHHAAVDRDHPDLMVAAYRYFGSYGSAVKAAGLNYDRIRVRPMPSWDKKRVQRRIKELERCEAGLWKRAVRRADPYLQRAADRCYGSYEKAIRAAGISSTALRPPPYRQWSPSRITDDLRKLYRRNPRLLKPTNLSQDQHRLLQACRRRFGSYERALAAAGIKYKEVARVTAPPLSAAEIITWLKDLFDKGRDLRYSKLAQSNPRLLEASRRCFGSYERAINAAGFDYPPAPPMRHWTAAIVLKTIKTLHRQHKDLRYRQFRKARLPLFEAARHYYGTYLNAIKAAGINYTDMVSDQLARQLPARKNARRS